VTTYQEVADILKGVDVSALKPEGTAGVVRLAIGVDDGRFGRHPIFDRLHEAAQQCDYAKSYGSDGLSISGTRDGIPEALVKEGVNYRIGLVSSNLPSILPKLIAKCEELHTKEVNQVRSR